jgi:Na+/H+-dicarboxylate symporter/ABC-type amino acid transport substrate-binding protein
MSLVTQALIGAILGILAGLFFGDSCAALQPVGNIYVMGLESVMYPVVICSIINGLAMLTPEITARLLRRGWLVVAGTWSLTLAVIWILSLALPPPRASITAHETARASGSLLEMIVPGNFFVDLSRNFLPAVVVFSVVYGVAVQRSKNKAALVAVLEVVYEGGLKVWQWVVRLAPLGVFALMAVTAGTVRIAVLPSLVAYLVLYTVGCLLIAFCFLPWLVSAMAPVRIGRIFSGMKMPLAMTLATTLPVVSLPYIQKLTAEVTDVGGIVDEDKVGSTTLSVFYGLAQIGNCFVYLTVLFGAFYFQHPIAAAQKALLPGVVVLSSIGTPSASVNAVSFLGGWLGMPGDFLNFYTGMMSFTRYPQIILTVMGFHAMTILVVLSYYGKLRVRPLQLAIRAAVIAVILLSLGLLARALEPHLDNAGQHSLATHSLAEARAPSIPLAVDGGPVRGETGEALEAVLRRGVLRVGVNTQTVPFVYYNARHELVGYDVASACALAQSLGCQRLELVPFAWDSLADDIERGAFDVAMSGIYMDESRLSQVSFSDPYYQDSLGLIVPREESARFANGSALRDAPLDLAIFRSQVLAGLAAQLFPAARTTVVSGYDALPETRFDAALWTREQAQAWCVLHPRYVAVRPDGVDRKLLFAYVVRNDSPRFLRYLDAWMRLELAQGFAAAQRAYWLEGKSPPDTTPRWSIMRDVLHW